MRSFMKMISRIIKNPSVGERDGSVRFLERCENFRLLLSANNSALKRMAELTESVRSSQPVSMTYIRAENVKISADVRNMIERLYRIAPGKYEGLKESFNNVILCMNREMEVGAHKPDGPFIIHISELDSSFTDETGSKMALLGEIASLPGISVPKGFSITASAFRFLMQETGLDEELKRIAQICGEGSYVSLRLLEKNVWETLSLFQMPSSLEKEILEAAEKLAARRKISFAVRSSALCEDSPGMSFAGQFNTELGVAPADILEAYRNVLASMYTVTAITYRTNHGVRDDELVMCAGCMEMVDAVAGGVAYSSDPAGLHPGQILVSAVHGLPSCVVNGVVRSDFWRLDKKSLHVLHMDKGDQEFGQFVSLDGNVVKRRLTPEKMAAPVLDEIIISQIGRAVLDIEEHFSCPQDVEWALTKDGLLYILQCRPLSIAMRDTIPVATDKCELLPVLMENCPCASSGIASGEINFVETDHDIPRFPFGGILLARFASPGLAALLPRASAVITEFGSCTGHLANVAREYEIPALIGVPDAVRSLKGENIVSVDGLRGCVFSGRVKEVEAPQKVKLSDTPVRRLMSSVLKHITPLNLTDPRSPEFTPDNCSTLHDITRFCHEKAVAEMFKVHGQIDGSAKQMEDGNRLQYWVIDLGGGLEDGHEAGESRCIRLEEIRSNAMKALWAGMTAFPWEGPPAVSAKGFAAVLFGATCNPALVPGGCNSMGERSYFIVDRHYCSLQSRMGFHYCTVEGYAGDDHEMNHVLFQFKGGGAGMDRRSLRLKLIAEILTEQGFYSSLRDDVLLARLEGVGPQEVERALMVVGYLLVQTRQLDMIMKDGPVVIQYRSRFDTEIKSLLSRGEK